MKNFSIAWSLLDNKNKNKFLFIIFLFIILSFLEILGIASVIPFITLLFNPESLKNIIFFKNYIYYFNNNKEILLPIFCLIFFSLFLIKNIFFIFTNRFINFFISNVRASISRKILKKYLNQNYLFFMTNSQGKLSTTLTNETVTFASQYLNSLMILLSELIILAGILLLIFLAGKMQGLIIILPLILLVSLLIRKLNKKIKYWSSKRVEINQNLTTLTQRIFIGIRDIFFSNSSDKLVDNYFSLVDYQSKLEAEYLTIQMIPRSLLEVSGIAILLSLIIYLNFLGIPEQTILTNLTFYFVVSYRAIPSYNKILIQYQRIKYSKNSAEIIFNNLNLKNDRVLKINKHSKYKFKKSIRLDNVSFSYNIESPIINKINLEIKKGEVIGLFGYSGSGKSTFLNILTLLIKPLEGNLFLDDNLIDDMSEVKKFQNLITFVSQDTFLIEDTIKNNIIFDTSKRLNIKKFNKATSFAQLNQFVESLPGKFNYIIGSHSRKISTGQKQRIAIARAIYNIKQILIFDEATNALDEQNENKIINNIYSLRKRHTIIIVSHSKKNLEHCDKIYEVKNNYLKKIK